MASISALEKDQIESDLKGMVEDRIIEDDDACDRVTEWEMDLSEGNV